MPSLNLRALEPAGEVVAKEGKAIVEGLIHEVMDGIKAGGIDIHPKALLTPKVGEDGTLTLSHDRQMNFRYWSGSTIGDDILNTGKLTDIKTELNGGGNHFEMFNRKGGIFAEDGSRHVSVIDSPGVRAIRSLDGLPLAGEVRYTAAHGERIPTPSEVAVRDLDRNFNTRSTTLEFSDPSRFSLGQLIGKSDAANLKPGIIDNVVRITIPADKALMPNVMIQNRESWIASTADDVVKMKLSK